MEGYFVITKDSEDEQSKQLKDALKKSTLVNLHCSRTFNRITKDTYKSQVSSAITHLRNGRPDNKEKRKEYHSRPEVRERIKDYNSRPDVKERKRLERERRKKLLSLVPAEVITKVYKEEENKSDE